MYYANTSLSVVYLFESRQSALLTLPYNSTPHKKAEIRWQINIFDLRKYSMLAFFRSFGSMKIILVLCFSLISCFQIFDVGENSVLKETCNPIIGACGWNGVFPG